MILRTLLCAAVVVCAACPPADALEPSNALDDAFTLPLPGEAVAGAALFPGSEAVHEGAFITLAGVENSNDVHGTVAGLHDLPSGSTFNSDYQAKFGKAPGAYSALAYACAQAIIQAVKATAATANGDLAAWRSAVRDYIFSSGKSYDTVMGTISFNACGDIEQPVMSFYKVDQTLNSNAGGWVYVKQQAFSPGGC